MQYSTNRARILCHLKGMGGTATAREIAEGLDLPCKAVQDALAVLHHMKQVTRTGRKFWARWSLQHPERPQLSWRIVSAAWFGQRL
jgi:predicted ArsR family transcriptional regulator